jgi:hypothetical protein
MSTDVEEGILSKANKILPLVQWILGIVIIIGGWAVSTQFTLNGHDKVINEHEEDLKQHTASIRSLELNEAAVLNTLKTIDKKLDQIDSKLDK